MDGFLVGELSALLGVPPQRLYRAAKEEGLAKVPGRRLRLPAGTAARWLRRWGSVPEAVRSTGLTREEAFVLAALSRSPLGLRSARSVARRASVTPTTAVKALASLERRGLVEERVERIVEGRVTETAVWRLNWRSPEWRRIAKATGSVVLPQPHAHPRLQRSVPSRFAHLFWNEDTSHLDVERDGVTIAERILSSTDAEAIAWAARTIPAPCLRRVNSLRNISPEVAALADALAASR